MAIKLDKIELANIENYEGEQTIALNADQSVTFAGDLVMGNSKILYTDDIRANSGAMAIGPIGSSALTLRTGNTTRLTLASSGEATFAGAVSTAGLLSAPTASFPILKWNTDLWGTQRFTRLVGGSGSATGNKWVNLADITLNGGYEKIKIEFTIGSYDDNSLGQEKITVLYENGSSVQESHSAYWYAGDMFANTFKAVKSVRNSASGLANTYTLWVQINGAWKDSFTVEAEYFRNQTNNTSISYSTDAGQTGTPSGSDEQSMTSKQKWVQALSATNVTGIVASANLDADTMHLGENQTVTNHKKFSDDKYITFGDGNDMRIFHDTSGAGPVNRINSAIALKIADQQSASVTIGKEESSSGAGDATDVVIANKLTVNGSFVAKGEMIIETTTNLAIKDSVITVNDGSTGTPSEGDDIGIMFERGNAGNVFMGWDESIDKFIFVQTDTDAQAATGLPTNGLSYSTEGSDMLTLLAGNFQAISGMTIAGNAVLHTASTFPTFNQNTTGSSASCTGNAATATALTSGNKTISGTITHSGLVQTTGTAIDQIKTFAMSFQLAANTWTDTGVSGDDLATGTYIMQCYVEDFNAGGGHYYEHFSATISWYGGGTNNDGAVDEIVTHQAGHHKGSYHVQFRTFRHTTGHADKLMLQVKQNFAHNTALNGATGKKMNFNFRRLI